MAKNTTLRDEIKVQNKKLKDMTWEQKKEYIWDYYKVHIIGTIIAIAAIVATIVMFNLNNYNTVLTVVVADGAMTGFDDNTDALTTEFSKYIGIDGKEDRVFFNNSFSLVAQTGDQDTSYSAAKIVTMAATNDIDGFLAEYDYITYFTDDEELFLTDLNELLTPEELKKISSALIYYTSTDGVKTPIAVDLTSTKIETETDLSMKRPCYGVVVSAANRDNAVKFIRYAFGL